MDLMTANRLQQLRKQNGYTQEVLAEKLGISRQSVSKWERAEASPDTDNLVALSKIYGISVDTLLNTSNDTVKIETEEKKKRDVKGKLKSILSKANDFGMYADIARKLFAFPYPLVVVVIYLVLSFAFNIWHPLWIIFLTIPIYYRFAVACKANNKKTFANLVPVPEIIVTAYLTICFATGSWGTSAILFLIIPIYYWIAIFSKNK